MDSESVFDTVPEEHRQWVGRTVERLAQEFEGVFSREAVQRLVGETLERYRAARVQNYVPMFVERLTRDRLWAAAKVEGKIESYRPMVLFLCIHNAGRSPMAAGWLQHLAGERAVVMSGGSTPASELNANAVTAMAEVGIDIRNHFPKPWTDEIVRAADVVITMGCGDACPIYPGKRYEDWHVADPDDADMDTVRRIRDDIGHRVRALADQLGIAPREA